ncbi:hypothetical protein VE03_10712 [Pseudogymnoascus sp. 23342-1-I1]|nr:hypothetical protein VE03_10712 [Pseudogymnoascus sp. 23342-1-I1]
MAIIDGNFDPLQIGPLGSYYMAATLSNPIDKVYEAAKLRPDDAIDCLVSIGMGQPVASSSKQQDQYLALISETDETAERFARTHQALVKGHRYFRYTPNDPNIIGFNATSEASARVASLAAEYFESPTVKKSLQQCKTALQSGSTNKD